MGIPDSKTFDLLEKLSENNLCQSWLARVAKTGTKCFLKVLTQSPHLDYREAVSVISKSFANQKRIKNLCVWTAHRKCREGGNLFVEYPYLDLDKWKSITPSIFAKDTQHILTEISIIVDYLHLLNLVHCDLKLSNFMIQYNDESLRVVLTDLDFLSAADSYPNSLVIGTPDHIAPEVQLNDRIRIQSDNYSLGVSLAKCLELLDGQHASGGPMIESIARNLSSFIELLRKEDYLKRPRLLTVALRSSGIIEPDKSEDVLRRLLSKQLLTSFRSGFGAPQEKLGRAISSFLTINNIVGFSEELINDFVSAYRRNRFETFNIFKIALSSSRTDRVGDFWHLSLSDTNLLGIYGSLDNTRPTKQTSGRSAISVPNLFASGTAYEKKGEFEKSLLSYMSSLDAMRESGSTFELPNRTTLLQRIGDIARRLGRLRQAADSYGELWASQEANQQFDLNVLYELTILSATLGRTSDATRLAIQGLEHSRSMDDKYNSVRFSRLQAWFLGLSGDYSKAERILDRIIEESLEYRHFDQLALSFHTYATMNWRRGEFERALEQSEKGYQIACQHNVRSAKKTLAASLAMIHGELARYTESLNYGKVALKGSIDDHDVFRVPLVCLMLMSANTRLARFRKAEYWLQRFWQAASQNVNTNHIIQYYLSQGFLRQISGEYDPARESLEKAISLFTDDTNKRHFGKAFQNLAEVLMMQGEQRECEEMAIKAMRHLEQTGDISSAAEIEMIRHLNKFYSGDQPALTLLQQTFVRLVDSGSNIYAGICFFHLLIWQEFDFGATTITALEQIRPLLKGDDAPLFKCIQRLLDDCSVDLRANRQSLKALKSAYKTLLQSQDRFLATVTCWRIADDYLLHGKTRLASKYIMQALKLAKDIGNKQLESYFNSKLESITHNSDDRAHLIESMHSISEILKNLDSYDDSLHQIVRFAIDESGAERGALLLKSNQTDQLRMAAYVNCDDDSLDDILEMSTSVTKKVLQESMPLIIDNAIEDNRTKGYKSIIYHNILSVACIPVTYAGQLLGVLYLDHHAIPALFESGDIVYAASIANFVAILLKMIERYKSTNLLNQQLETDLANLGSAQTLITRDRAMRDLIEKLPIIAKTNAPVLIYGESGTGKEILCQMIHDLSGRCGKPLLKMNCAAIPGDLIESELFGIARNAATGVDERDGKFLAADGSTLFLDEIGDMPIELQSKVLRVLEYQQFEKVGSNRTIHTDIRFIYATNKDLRSLVKQKLFREDLFYRVNTITLEIPPLRERPDDIILLVEHFMILFSPSGRAPMLSADVLEVLRSFNWPGNVRELKNWVERVCILYPQQTVRANMLPKEFLGFQSSPLISKKVVESREMSRIRSMLIECAGNQSLAAKSLGMPLSTMRRRMKKYGISK